MNRYEVDQRVGCVAVVDTSVGTSGQCLSPDDWHVVRYWSGRRIPRWKKVFRLVPDYATWELPRRHLWAARRLADRLNREETS